MRRCMWDRKDCQYKGKGPWISTGNPRVMSHSYILLYIEIGFNIDSVGGLGGGGRGGGDIT